MINSDYWFVKNIKVFQEHLGKSVNELLMTYSSVEKATFVAKTWAQGVNIRLYYNILTHSTHAFKTW